MPAPAWPQAAPSGQQSSSETETGTQTPTKASQQAQRREQMKAICQEHIEAMKTDVQEMYSAFDKLKANVASITSAGEMERWQANVAMWQIVVDHHEQMLKPRVDAQAQGHRMRHDDG